MHGFYIDPLAPILLRPQDREVIAEFCQADPFRLVATENPLHNRWGERRQPQKAADIRAIDTVGSRKVFKAGVFAGFKLLLSAVRFGQGGNK